METRCMCDSGLASCKTLSQLPFFFSHGCKIYISDHSKSFSTYSLILKLQIIWQIHICDFCYIYLNNHYYILHNKTRFTKITYNLNGESSNQHLQTSWEARQVVIPFLLTIPIYDWVAQQPHRPRWWDVSWIDVACTNIHTLQQVHTHTHRLYIDIDMPVFTNYLYDAFHLVSLLENRPKVLAKGTS